MFPSPHSLWSVHICCTGHRALLVHQRSDDNYHIFGIYHCGRSCCLLPAGRRCRSLSHTIAVSAGDALHKKIYIDILCIHSPRSLVVAIAMMCGRLGALSGNLLFPVFVEIGCVPPFVMVGSMMLRKLHYYYEHFYLYLSRNLTYNHSTFSCCVALHFRAESQKSDLQLNLFARGLRLLYCIEV